MRARSRIAILALAAIVAALLWFLLPGGDGPTAPTPAGGSIASAPRPAAGSGAKVPRVEDPADVLPDAGEAPSGPTLEIRARVAGEWPLPGVQILPVSRDAEGTLWASIGDDAPDSGETDAEGCLTLRYTSEPAERLFGVLVDGVVADGAVNADPAGAIREFKVFRATPEGVVTLLFRDPDGAVLVRPVDDLSGEVLVGRPDTVFLARVPGQDEEAFTPAAPAPGGWLRLVDVGGEEVRLVVPGYLPSVPLGKTTKGRTILRLQRDAAAHRGRIVLLAGSGQVVDAELHSAVDGSPCRAEDLRGLPTRGGPFALSGVPPGTWDLVVRAWPGVASLEATHWATVRFTVREVGTDLGEIRPIPGAIVRARLLRKDGLPETEAPLLLATGYPGHVPLLAYEGSPVRGSVGISWPRFGNVGDGSTESPGEDGWVEFRGLRPGGTFVVATGLVPGLIRVIPIPLRPSGPVVVELDAGGPSTTCALTFKVNGVDPVSWSAFHGPAFATDFSTGKGTLEAEIPPGHHLFGAMAEVPGIDEDGAAGTVWEFFSAEVDIPDSGRFETTVDLKPRGR